MNGPAFPNCAQCTATSKRTGERCRAPAVRGYTVCRFHGARGGAPSGKSNGAYKHGQFTAEAIEERRIVSDFIKAARNTLTDLAD